MKMLSFDWLPWRMARALREAREFNGLLVQQGRELADRLDVTLLALRETQEGIKVRFNLRFQERNNRGKLHITGALVPKQVSYQIAVPLVELLLSKNEKLHQIRAGLIRNMVDDGMRLIQEDLLRQVQEMDGGRKQRQA
jgi:hypothetical protein